MDFFDRKLLENVEVKQTDTKTFDVVTMIRKISPRELMLDGKPSSLLGQGSFAKVTKGLYQKKPVAVKKLDIPSSLLEQDKWKSILSNEALILQLLDDSNIVRFIGVDIPQGMIVMELATCSLTDIIYPSSSVLVANAFRGLPIISQEKLTVAWKLRVVSHLVKALVYVHDMFVLHRDIKPSNVMLFFEMGYPENVIAKLADFGLAKVSSLVPFLLFDFASNLSTHRTLSWAQ